MSLQPPFYLIQEEPGLATNVVAPNVLHPMWGPLTDFHNWQRPSDPARNNVPLPLTFLPLPPAMQQRSQDVRPLIDFDNTPWRQQRTVPIPLAGLQQSLAILNPSKSAKRMVLSYINYSWNGTPAAGANVTIFWVDPVLGYQTLTYYTQTTAGNGQISFPTPKRFPTGAQVGVVLNGSVSGTMEVGSYEDL